MIKDNPEILPAIVAVINKTATNQEKMLVDNWLSEDERNYAIFEKLQKIRYNGSFEHAYDSKERIFNIIQNRVSKYSYKRKTKMWQYISAASIALLIIIGGLSLFSTIKSTDENISYVETKCEYGSKSKITLSDGSIVELNSGSVLRYPNSFSGKERVVVLEGEAYFDVAKNKQQPFVVKTNSINVKVLGTHFNVKAYFDDNKIITTLLEGLVKVEKTDSLLNEQSIILSPNQQYVFDRLSGSVNINEVDASMYTTWRNGSYYFDTETFSDIVKKLERGFNIRIDIKSPRLQNELFSGVFDRGESIQQILDLFKKHRKFDYRQAGNVIEIYEI